METRVLNDLSLVGAIVFENDNADWPSNPAIGTMILKDQVLYAYIAVGGMETWYPFSTPTNSYVHTQGLASTTWVVNHGLGTTNVWFQVKDANGNVVIAGKEDINSNSFRLSFTSAITGTVMVVAPDTIDVPAVRATMIDVGTVQIRSDNISINGNNVLTAASFADVAISGDYDDLVNKPTLFSGAYADLSNKPTLFSGAYADLTGKPSLATVATSGSYADLTNKPTIPTVPTDVSSFNNDSGYQTSAQVNTAIQAVVGAAPEALDTLAEIAAQLANDESAAAALTTVVSGKANSATTLSGYGITDAYTKTEVNTSLALKANTSSLATVATSGAYSDLSGKPTLFSGAYADLTGKPTLFSGSYTDLTNKPTLFSGSFADLTSKPTTLAGYGVTSVSGGTF